MPLVALGRPCTGLLTFVLVLAALTPRIKASIEAKVPPALHLKHALIVFLCALLCAGWGCFLVTTSPNGLIYTPLTGVCE